MKKIMKYVYLTGFYLCLLISEIHACDVMGARGCGQRPNKDDQESDPIKYCIASKVYFECVHKKYRGCENKEKYELAMESMLKGIRKRADDLLEFCSEKIEDYKFNIIWEPTKKPKTIDSVRYDPSLKNNSDQFCQSQTIYDICSPLAFRVKFNPSWNSFSKRHWCQRISAYYHCIKTRLDQCTQQTLLDQFQQVEHNLQSQAAFNCPGGVNGCTRRSTDPRCKIGLNVSNRSRKMSIQGKVFIAMVLPILLCYCKNSYEFLFSIAFYLTLVFC